VNEEHFYPDEESEKLGPKDPKDAQALAVVGKLIRAHPDKVFFSRQIEVQNEGEFFHWVTNRAIRDLEGSLIQSEMRPLKTGGTIKVLWNKSYRYYKRDASELVKLVEEYAGPNIGAALGRHGELWFLKVSQTSLCTQANQLGSTAEKNGKKLGTTWILYSSAMGAPMGSK
jgi:hypothetical protein